MKKNHRNDSFPLPNHNKTFEMPTFILCPLLSVRTKFLKSIVGIINNYSFHAPGWFNF